MDFAGWIFADILMPVVLPVLGMLVLIPLLGRLPQPHAGLSIMTVVKDGQLCWLVIGMGTAAFYDVWSAGHAHRPVPAWGGIAQLGLIAVMLPAMVLAAGGAVLATPLLTSSPPDAAPRLSTWLRHCAVFVTSAVMELAVANVCCNSLSDVRRVTGRAGEHHAGASRSAFSPRGDCQADNGNQLRGRVRRGRSGGAGGRVAHAVAG